jgi:hypothetical protein
MKFVNISFAGGSEDLFQNKSLPDAIKKDDLPPGSTYIQQDPTGKWVKHK